MYGAFGQTRGFSLVQWGSMREALRILRGEADLCRRLAAAIYDAEVIDVLLAAADEATALVDEVLAEPTVH